MEVPLVDKDYLLERTPGNGGWTYAPIPEVPQDKKAPFGWVKVKVVLYLDEEPSEIPEELQLCLQDEPRALEFFNSLAENERHNYVKWIYSAKTDRAKVARMAKAIDRLASNLKYYDKG